MKPTCLPDPARERAQLETGFLVGTTIAFVLIGVIGWPVLGSVAAGFALFQFVGWASYDVRGRDVYIVLQALVRVIQTVITPLLLLLMYGLSILLCGTIARLVGMNHLKRDFSACRNSDTMFSEAPRTTRDDFERQS